MKDVERAYIVLRDAPLVVVDYEQGVRTTPNMDLADVIISRWARDQIIAALDKLKLIYDSAEKEMAASSSAVAHENQRLRAALSWMADQDPQMVDAARQRFQLKE